jgi:hypothetical protein
LNSDLLIFFSLGEFAVFCCIPQENNEGNIIVQKFQTQYCGMMPKFQNLGIREMSQRHSLLGTVKHPSVTAKVPIQTGEQQNMEFPRGQF